jgi:replicative DNA helicase
VSTAKRVPYLQLVSPPTVAGKLPPHDLEAEAAVLSACLLKPACMDEVARMLRAEHFYSEANRLVWTAMLAIAERGAPIDVVQVASELRDRDRLPQAGGTAYLAQIVDATPAIAHVVAHATTVLRKARVRATIAAMQVAVAEGYNDHGEDETWMRDVPIRVEQAAQAGAVLQTSRTIFEAGEEMTAAIERTRALAELGVRPGLDVGDPNLQKLTGGLHEAEVTMLSAPTKGFKTTRAMAMVMAAASSVERYIDEGQEKQRPNGVAVFELEMTDTELAMLAACQVGGADRERFRLGTATPGDYDKLFAGKHGFEKLPIIIDARTDLTIDTLRAAVREARVKLWNKFKAPLRLVVIDTVQLLATKGNTDPDAMQGLVDAAGARIRELSLEKEFARTSWLVLSQLNSQGQMRGSRALEQHCTSWWDLRVVDDDSPQARDYIKVARITVKLQRSGKQGSDVIAAAWLNTITGRVYG